MEHANKVWLRQEDLTNGNIDKATERMNPGNGCFAKHSTAYEQPMNWNDAKMIGGETQMALRKFVLRVANRRENEIKVLNNNFPPVTSLVSHHTFF